MAKSIQTHLKTQGISGVGDGEATMKFTEVNLSNLVINFPSLGS